MDKININIFFKSIQPLNSNLHDKKKKKKQKTWLGRLKGKNNMECLKVYSLNKLKFTKYIFEKVSSLFTYNKYILMKIKLYRASKNLHFHLLINVTS